MYQRLHIIQGKFYTVSHLAQESGEGGFLVRTYFQRVLIVEFPLPLIVKMGKMEITFFFSLHLPMNLDKSYQFPFVNVPL